MNGIHSRESHPDVLGPDHDMGCPCTGKEHQISSLLIGGDVTRHIRCGYHIGG